MSTSSPEPGNLEERLAALRFEGEPPRLSPGFDARLWSRLEQEAARRTVRWPRLALRLYWAAAAVASLALLARLDGAWLGAFSPEVRVWLLLAVLASPTAALFDPAWVRRLVGSTG